MLEPHPSTTPQLREAFQILLPIAYQWQNIATLLGLPGGQIEAIEHDTPTVNDGLRKMLLEWLKQINPHPSWERLAEAVDSLGNQTKAKEIREKYNIM